MVDKTAMIKEFESVRAKYLEVAKKLVDGKVPGAIDLAASTCDHGTVCHGGGARGTIDVRVNPPYLKKIGANVIPGDK